MNRAESSVEGKTFPSHGKDLGFDSQWAHSSFVYSTEKRWGGRGGTALLLHLSLHGTNESARPICAYHKDELVIYSGALVCAKCLSKNYAIKLPKAGVAG